MSDEGRRFDWRANGLADQTEEELVDAIERELVLPVPPEQVWEVLTAPGWLGDEVEFDLVPGGDARFLIDAEERAGWVEEAVAPNEDDGGHLVFWWAADGEPASRVEVTLTPEGPDATRFRVLEARPLEVLDLVGIPLPGSDGSTPGPAMLSLA